MLSNSFVNEINSTNHKENPPLSRIKFLEGFNFILSHFDGRLFPRTITTYNLKNKQVEVYSKEEALKLFENSNYIDCRINAFPSFTDYKGIQRYPPDFIFIDLDKSNFQTDKELKRTLKNILTNIKENLEAYPTVLKTGNGYHIYQPINGLVLEEYSAFNKICKMPSTEFLRFAEKFLSNNKADPFHNQSFKSSMVRIPNSYNSKLLNMNNDNSLFININLDSQVNILRKWNGIRPNINLLLGYFSAFIVNKSLKTGRIKDNNCLNNIQYNLSSTDSYSNNKYDKFSSIPWIETLLDISIEDYRKSSINLILLPYLIIVKKFSYEQAFNILKNWLQNCNKKKEVDFDIDYYVKVAINTSIKKGIPPMKFTTLQQKNQNLFNLLKRVIVKRN
jgi:hypothetical protein